MSYIRDIFTVLSLILQLLVSFVLSLAYNLVLGISIPVSFLVLATPKMVQFYGGLMLKVLNGKKGV